MSIHIRKYKPEDIDELIALFRTSVRKVARKDYTEDQVLAWAPETIDRGQWSAKRASRPTWVAKIGTAIVGFSDLEANGCVDMMYVHPDYQGQGVARALLKEIESEARASGFSSLYTEASITARPFFERHGFKVVKEQTVQFGGQEFINYRMEKFFSSP